MFKTKVISGREVFYYIPETEIKGLIVLANDKQSNLIGGLEYIKKVTGKESEMLMVSVSPTNWYEEFSPWPADDIYSAQPHFLGQLENYLKDLFESVLPDVKNEFNIDFPVQKQGIMGYSMGGIASLYTFGKYSEFAHVAACSASVWYPGFIEWMENAEVPVKSGSAYLSLGDREQTDFLPSFSYINRQIKEVKGIIEKKLDNPSDVMFEWNPGEHADNGPQRVGKALLYMESKIKG